MKLKFEENNLEVFQLSDPVSATTSNGLRVPCIQANV